MATIGFRVYVSDLLAFLRNTGTCKDKDVHCHKTHEELLNLLKKHSAVLPKDMLESYLYNCNMNQEDKRFWHPEGKSFTRMVQGILPDHLMFDRVTNLIREKKK